jgi:hypothetical protein
MVLCTSTAQFVWANVFTSLTLKIFLHFRKKEYKREIRKGYILLNFDGAQELIPRNQFASLCSLAVRYDNPIPTRFLAPIICSKIPALTRCHAGMEGTGTASKLIHLPQYLFSEEV